MTLCRLVVILGVFIALFDHADSRGFTGNYQQAAMIQKASRTINDEPLVINYRRKRFSRQDSRISRNRKDVGEKSIVESSQERVYDHFQGETAQDGRLIVETRVRRADDSDSTSKLFEELQKLTGNVETEENEQNNTSDTYLDARELAAKIVSALTLKTASINGVTDESDVKKILRYGLEKMNEGGVHKSAAEKLQALLAAILEANRMKRQAVEAVQENLEHGQSSKGDLASDKSAKISFKMLKRKMGVSNMLRRRRKRSIHS